jgi:hypothetical protein
VSRILNIFFPDYYDLAMSGPNPAADDIAYAVKNIQKIEIKIEACSIDGSW